MKSSTLLIVEDEAIIAMGLEERLIQLGYTIVGSVGSGEAALRLAASTPIDLALMDIHIQGAYDGIQLASELRARHNIPIVYLTAHADDMTMKRARITEPFGYLIKPFRERELHTTIELALDRYRSECELRHVHAQYEHVVEQQRQATLVAQEVNIPLQTMQHLLHLADSDDATKRAHALRLAAREVERTGELTRRLLDLQRLTHHE